MECWVYLRVINDWNRDMYMIIEGQGLKVRKGQYVPIFFSGFLTHYVD